MALAFNIDFTETVVTTPNAVHIDCETLDQAGKLIAAIVQYASETPNVEVTGFAVTAK